MDTYTVQVGHTDRTRDADGRFTTFTTNVQVMADNDTDATMVAAQMVAAIRHDAIDGQVTFTQIVSMVV